MKIELFNHKSLTMPVPFFVETNEVALELVDFITMRDLHPQKIHKLYRKAKTKRLTDILQRVVYFINQLAAQEYEFMDDGRTKTGVGIDYRTATYENNMKPLIDTLREGHWKEESLEQYVKDWRAFYRYLTYRGIDHNMFMPDTIEKKYKPSQDSNFVSHTSYDNSQEGEEETAIDSRLKAKKENYSEDVISIEQFKKLYKELSEDDEVYAAMAYTDITTYLRVSALTNDFPLFQTPLNPKFKPYPVAVRDAKLRDETYESQYIFYNNKGGTVKKCILTADVHQEIHEKYINSESVNHAERESNFVEYYCKKEYAEQRGITPDMRFSWLKRNGTPVTVRDYQRALARGGEKIGIDMHPHMLRHTGATLVVYEALCSITGNTEFSAVNEMVASDVHKIVQMQLGHKNIETTLLYIRTIEKFTKEAKLTYLINKVMSKGEEEKDLLLSKCFKKGLEAWRKAI
jgi:integrase